MLKTGRKLCGIEETDTCLGLKVKLQDQLGMGSRILAFGVNQGYGERLLP